MSDADRQGSAMPAHPGEPRIACEHGANCSCRMLAAAVGAEPGSINYWFCKHVLQKRWRMACDHLPRATPKHLIRALPAYDPRNPVHAILVANASVQPD